MKKLLLLAAFAASAFAWDCSSKEPVKLKIPPTHFCMKIAAHETLVRYDRVSIATGHRITFNKDFQNKVIEIMNDEYIQCYETCLMDYTN